MQEPATAFRRSQRPIRSSDNERLNKRHLLVRRAAISDSEGSIRRGGRFGDTSLPSTAVMKLAWTQTQAPCVHGLNEMGKIEELLAMAAMKSMGFGERKRMMRELTGLAKIWPTAAAAWRPLRVRRPTVAQRGRRRWPEAPSTSRRVWRGTDYALDAANGVAARTAARGRPRRRRRRREVGVARGRPRRWRREAGGVRGKKGAATALYGGAREKRQHTVEAGVTAGSRGGGVAGRRWAARREAASGGCAIAWGSGGAAIRGGRRRD
ncbi:hypothetical protein PVAP13_6KG365018 [Panicum virgatum]|uniref:Uncharacterized protein n=1 Tax=Panicum virgatum TaxID=38727 RepID=A0A8T0RIM2_PANVG|nr:hypothetical protein PVAP13_6KG365018 [Panicum virgatum]